MRRTLLLVLILAHSFLIPAQEINLDIADDHVTCIGSKGFRQEDVATPDGGIASAIVVVCAFTPIDEILISGAVVAGAYVGKKVSELLDSISFQMASEHTKNKRPSSKDKHEAGQDRRKTDNGGEKADDRRRPPRKQQ